METGGGGKGQVQMMMAAKPIRPEDVWNAAIRAGVDPARMALSLCHVLGEVTLAESDAGQEDDTVAVRYKLKSGQIVEYDAGLHNPFKGMTFNAEPVADCHQR